MGIKQVENVQKWCAAEETGAKTEGSGKEIPKISNFMPRVTINNFRELNQRKLMEGASTKDG